MGVFDGNLSPRMVDPTVKSNRFRLTDHHSRCFDNLSIFTLIRFL